MLEAAVAKSAGTWSSVPDLRQWRIWCRFTAVLFSPTTGKTFASARETNRQGLMKAKTEEIFVLTSAIEEKTVRLGTLAVEVKKMRAELCGQERSLLADKELASKSARSCTTHASK